MTLACQGMLQHSTKHSFPKLKYRWADTITVVLHPFPFFCLAGNGRQQAGYEHQTGTEGKNALIPFFFSCFWFVKKVSKSSPKLELWPLPHPDFWLVGFLIRSQDLPNWPGLGIGIKSVIIVSSHPPRPVPLWLDMCAVHTHTYTHTHRCLPATTKHYKP